jgi:hypothetical protein
VYHLELRKFPHTVARFNQSEAQVRAIVVPWVNEQWFEEGEQKWNSNEATLTVLEGPKLSMPELAMGRGWRNAQRRSHDVTERVLEAVKREVATAAGPASAGVANGTAGGGGAAGAAGAASGDGAVGASGAPGASEGEVARGDAADARLLADSLALELLALLDDGPLPLARVWELADRRLDISRAADSLGLGEAAVRSLLARALVVLRADQTPVQDDRIDATLRAPASWSRADDSPQIARKA